MKTKFLSLLLPVCIAAHVTASPIGEKEKGINKETKKDDTSEVIETHFEMELDPLSGVLTVDVDGKFDQYSSVSVTNNRGSEYFFQFVENGSNQLTFNLTELEKGSYFLVLNTNNEIRIKRFLID
jgi:hypothetical protein